MKTKSLPTKQILKTRKPISKKRGGKEKPKKTVPDHTLGGQGEKYWQTQFILTEHWRSDIEFFNDELRFLQRLMDKYLVWISDNRLMENSKKIMAELGRIKKRRENFEKQTAEHLHHLTNLIENPFAHDAQECKKEHETLEPIIAELAKDFRALKKEVFQLVEILDTEQTRPLLEAQ